MIVNYAVENKHGHDIDLSSEQRLVDEIDFDDMEIEFEDDSDD